MSFVQSQLPTFPESWRVLPFDEALEDVTGGNAKVQTRDFRSEGKLRVIDQGQFDIAGYVDDVSLACKAPLPCILFGDHTRIFKFAEAPFALGADGVKVLAPRQGLDARFAFHYLRTVRLPEDLGYSRHFKYLREATVPVPPLEEQRRIVDILDRADAMWRKRREIVVLSEELLRSVFLEMFGDPVTNPRGWELKPLGEMLSFLTSGSRGWARHYRAEGDLFLRIQNVLADRLDLSDVAYVEAPDSAEARRTVVQANDVLLSITADLGRTCVIPPGLGNAFVNQHLAILRLAHGEAEYVSTFLASAGGQLQFSRLNRHGVKAGLNFDDIRGVRVMFPPLERQRAFVEVKARLRQLEGRHTEGVRESKRLFDSLVSQAFAGSLRLGQSPSAERSSRPFSSGGSQ